MMAFLPALCRHLLGEYLLMPSVATWWCGQDSARQYVRQHADQLVIKPSARRFGELNFPADLDRAARAQLLERMEARPADYVAQEQVALSTVPVRTDEGLAPRHLVMRVFAVWNGDEYVLMPGGLTRVSSDAISPVVNMQLGSGSKDTWIVDTAHPVAANPAA